MKIEQRHAKRGKEKDIKFWMPDLFIFTPNLSLKEILTYSTFKNLRKKDTFVNAYGRVLNFSSKKSFVFFFFFFYYFYYYFFLVFNKSAWERQNEKKKVHQIKKTNNYNLNI